MKKILFFIALTLSVGAFAQPITGSSPTTPRTVTKNVVTDSLFGSRYGSGVLSDSIRVVGGFLFEDGTYINTGNFSPDSSVFATKYYVGHVIDSLGLQPGGVSSNVQFNNNGAFEGAENLNWNDTLQVLNIGPWRGSDELNIYADTLENSKIYMEGCGSLNGIVVATNHGTLANPQPRTTRGTIGEFSAAKWNGTNFVSSRGASMTLFSTQAPWSADANGMGIKFYCVANNTTSSVQALQIWGNGNISTSPWSSLYDTAWEMYIDGECVISTALPSISSDDSITVRDTGGLVRSWKPYRYIALKNDTNSMLGLNIGGKVGTDEINVYADAGENAKQYFEGTGSSNGIFGTRNFGTIATPLPPSTASTLITFGNAAWNGTAFTSVKRGSFDVFSTQAWGASNNACGIRINYVPNASTTSTQGFQIWSNGNAAFSSNSADTLYKLYADGEIRASGKITAGDDITTSSGGSFTWSGSKSRITSNTNGTITLSNNAISGFNLLYFGGTTSSFPAIQRQNNVIRFLVSDTSAYAGVQTGQLSVNSAPNASAALTVTSTTQGFLPPVMTSTQGSAIASPATGLLIYVTDTNGTFTSTGWWGYNGSAWEKLNN